MRIDIRADLKPLQKAFVDFRAKQVPFATALALNSLATGVRDGERKDILETFDKPTPFTQNAYAIAAAAKSKPIATVFAKDVQASYLLPYVDGGPRWLGSKKAMLVPRDVGLNAYGNIPRGKLQALKGKPGVFIGTVKFRKSGKSIGGVWQRPITGERRAGDHGTKGNTRNKVGGVDTGLKLLIQFEATTPAPKHLEFYLRAQTYIHANAAAAFDMGMKRALATAKP